MNQSVDGVIDARPIRPVSTRTAWDNAIARREELTRAVRETLKREQIEAAVFVSGNGNYPPWVRMEAWLPGAGGQPGAADDRERAELEFVIEVKPYHEHDTVVRARGVRGKEHIEVPVRPEFSGTDATEWCLFTLGRAGKPSNYSPKLDALLHLIATFLPFLPQPHRNRIEKQYRARWTGTGILGMVSMLMLVVGPQMAAGSRGGGEGMVGAVAMLLGIAGLIGTFVWVRGRSHRISVLPQPIETPRNLGLVDSWHAVISDLGRDFLAVRTRLVRAVAGGHEALGLICRGEVYTHTLPNGYEQRDRLVIAKDQGMVHVHIYSFGNDVFVGWQAFLNWSRWGETKAVSTRVQEGSQVEYRDVAPSGYVPNQFDLIDLSSLSEFVHRRLEREIRVLLKEKSIDQEIDFKIIRGDRDRALDQERHGSSDSKGSSSTWSYKAT